MRKMGKKSIIMGLAIVVLAIVIYGIGRSLASPNTEYKATKVSGLSFENPSITYKKELSTFTVDVYNENKKTYTMKSIDIILTNKNKESITLNYEISSLEADEGRKIIISKIDYDLREYTKINYKINK